ncbi:hypothetical protein J7E96_33980 [Streptomyces sp. ISL-96]|uniref:hypothetical protein n=1 Tax=Streptomyces sp. ISL-96 TaxID=2819191 RepID=UPI001BECD117|nr:hypothetical protein [Streptomyces sp. ISL-96]MBT2493425.1 hypothetical protein [Streptomyces sp. ISL-96]
MAASRQHQAPGGEQCLAAQERGADEELGRAAAGGRRLGLGGQGVDVRSSGRLMLTG